MPDGSAGAGTADRKRRRESGRTDRSVSEEARERKERVLTHGAPALTASIADAVVAKNGGLYLLTCPDGSVPFEQGHGYGLFHHDCRYLSGYALRLAGTAPVALASDAAGGFMSFFQLTNPELGDGGDSRIGKETISVRWEHVLDEEHLALHDRISLTNFGTETVALPVTLSLRACFEDIYVVRGFLDDVPGEQRPPEWNEDGSLRIAYHGADDRWRVLDVDFSPSPDRRHGAVAEFRLRLEPGERKELAVRIAVGESDEGPAPAPRRSDLTPLDAVEAVAERNEAAWLRERATIRTGNPLVSDCIERALRDLRLLRTGLEGDEFFAAGVPWFVTLFGRDAAITALQTLALDHDIAAETLRLLAKHQGRANDEWREEAPGKILHELRVGELARMGAIPYTPYYGTVDATSLFLLLAGEHARWCGDLALFRELKDPIEAAIEWTSTDGDSDGDGFIDYRRISDDVLVNEGWKDSGDAMVNGDGSVCEPPIAPLEAQAYTYRALGLLADVFERDGDARRAGELRERAERLRTRFERSFWMEELGTYAMALQRGGRPADVVSSNPGHALWSGIADPERAARTIDRLMAEDVFSGWGVRTLSTRERRFNPVSYHLGSVWPHDTAIAAAGFRRYGGDREACRLFSGLIDAAVRLSDRRLPELFAGFSRDDFPVPVSYPVANRPQAWSAATLPFFLVTLLGLEPDAFERRLLVRRPVLPECLPTVELEGIRVADATAHLAFRRTDAGVEVDVVSIDGDLTVERA